MPHPFRALSMRLLLALTRGTRLKGRLRLAMALNRFVMPPGGFVRSRMRSGLVMELDLTDSLQQWFHYLGEYETPESALILSMLPPDGVFVDVGANVGWHTLQAAAHLQGRGWVYAFEPLAMNAERLVRNLELNGLSNVTVEVLGLTDRAETVDLATEFLRSGNASMARRGAVMRGHYDVRCLPFDEYVSRQGLDRIDFIKIDVEGAELRTLKGMTRVLTRPNAPPVLCELNPVLLSLMGSSAREVESYFESHGYEARPPRGRQGTPRLDHGEAVEGHTNVLFVHRG